MTEILINRGRNKERKRKIKMIVISHFKKIKRTRIKHNSDNKTGLYNFTVSSQRSSGKKLVLKPSLESRKHSVP